MRSKLISTILNLEVAFLNNKIYTTNFQADGTIFTTPVFKSQNLFSFYFNTPNQKFVTKLMLNPTYILLYKAGILTYLSNLEIYPQQNAQYARSPGTYALLLKKNWLQHTTLVKLPSGVKKVFSLYSAAQLSRTFFKEKKTILNTKSGY